MGFRPTVYRYAVENGLSGRVINTSSGVVIEVEGKNGQIKKFLDTLTAHPPPQSKIDKVLAEDIPPTGEKEFVIGKSLAENETASIVPADLAFCDGCRSDILRKSNRRYWYPFTNCTHCGPRFTIVERLPYDRPFTTMRRFAMCQECLAEYENPLDRRFHAQPNACPACGPNLEWNRKGQTKTGREALKAAVKAIRMGQIVAIQSLGGFHLACDASNAKAVRTLRTRKKRPHKPFAIMVSNLKQAEELCEFGKEEAKILRSPQAPIMMLRGKTRAPEGLAPGLRNLAVMLPYTPLHEILFAALNEKGFSSPLVMTSGNKKDEPICRTPDEARQNLSGIADAFLFHDRPIHNRCDDSVVFISKGAVHPVRRSRGYVPNAVRLAKEGPPILGCGADLKNAFCLTRRGEAFLSQHIGDMEEESARNFYLEAFSKMKSFLGVEPEIIAHDLHPDYHSTRIAGGLPGRKIGVQHHFAHIAGVLAEHRVSEPVLGAALDGTGYGTDGTIWGGEFMEVNGPNWKRLGHLKPFPLPGGDAAVLEIWRVALSCMKTFCPDAYRKKAKHPLQDISPKKLKTLERMMETGVNSPKTSSMGRLFDAVACLAGLRTEATYEAQAAMELESLCENRPRDFYRFELKQESGILFADPAPVLEGILMEKGPGRAKNISEKFHASVSDMVCRMLEKLSQKTGIRTVALSGGVFQNQVLLDWTVKDLSKTGLKVLINRQVPTNDGGISLGQAWAALQNFPTA